MFRAVFVSCALALLVADAMTGVAATTPAIKMPYASSTREIPATPPTARAQIARRGIAELPQRWMHDVAIRWCDRNERVDAVAEPRHDRTDRMHANRCFVVFARRGRETQPEKITELDLQLAACARARRASPATGAGDGRDGPWTRGRGHAAPPEAECEATVGRKWLVRLLRGPVAGAGRGFG